MAKENWKPGKCVGSVVTDSIEGFEKTIGYVDPDYYGGTLIAESIWRQKDVKLIAAAPDLLEACNTLIQQAEICGYETEDGLHKLLDNRAIVEIKQAIKKATE